LGGLIGTVMGVDIKPGYSPRSRRTPRYFVVVIRNSEVVAKYDDVPLYRLIRLIIEHHVDVLAVDNLYELTGSVRGLVKLSKLIPPWCKIVEVTWTPEGYKSTEVLAKEHGLPKPMDPESTAFLNAILAEKGFGREIKLHVDRVYVVVSKGRTPHQGGASSDRFKRGIRASVLQVVKEIKEILDENKLDYDLVVKESEGGLERGFFIIYAPMEKVREIVPSIQHKNVKVKIEPALSGKSPIEPKKTVILGLDPGVSVGIAILDLNGQPLMVKSYKTPDRELIIDSILSHGKPIIVAVDVEKPPEYVKKIASLLDAILYTPEEDISVDEKQEIVAKYLEKFSIDVEDAHARDALAAAIKAYGHIKPIIDEVDSKIRGIVGISRDEVIGQVIRGRALSDVLEELFMKTLSRGEESRLEHREKPVKSSSEETQRLQLKIRELEQVIRRLERELERREEQIKNLELELNYLKKKPITIEEYERRIAQLKLEIELLRKSLDEKTRITEFFRDRIMLLERILVEMGKGEYILICKSSSMEACSGQPVFLDNPLHLEQAISYAKAWKTGIVTIAGTENLNWHDLRVPIVIEQPVLELGNYVLVKSTIIGEIKKQWGLIDELESKERRDRIIKMIKEYQESRRKTS